VKKEILDRYSVTEDGKIIIDITSDKIEYLYNDFDKHTPYIKKELDQDLVDYLIECMRDIGEDKFLIQFRIIEKVDTDLKSRVQTSIQSYFTYLKELEIRDLKQMLRTSSILLLTGIIILTVSVWFNDYVELHKSVINKVFAEGLTVAAWISLWESLATFLINWAPHKRQIKLCERLARASVLFKDELLLEPGVS
jgi:hypothetical protein